MNVCFVCEAYPPERWGGIEVFTQTLARGLVARGHHVSVVGFSGDRPKTTREDDQGVRVLRLPPVASFSCPRMITARLGLESVIRAEIRSKAIDLVECPDVQGQLLLGHFGVPLVVRMHGANMVHFPATGRSAPRLTPFFEKRTLHLATHLVGVSSYIRDATLRAADLYSRPCEIIYNGVDSSLFRPDPRVSRDPNRILFVGRMMETKGAPNLFRALGFILQRFPSAYLRFVGPNPSDQHGITASQTLLAALIPQQRGSVDAVGQLRHGQMPDEYRQAAVAVFPSRAEAHPIAVVEAMACGTPVVFMDHGPGPEMIEHGQEGLLCDTRSPEAIAEAVVTLLADPAGARVMGARAAKRVAEKHSLPAFIEQNERFYLHCLEQHARPHALHGRL